MLEGMVPYFKRALVVAVVLCGFFTTAQFAFAQVTFNPDGSINRPTLPQFRPTLPNNPTPDTEPPIFPGDVGAVDPGTGRPISGVPVDPVTGQPIPGATETTQTEESPALRVDHGSCQWDSVQGGLYCLVISGFGSFASIAGWLFDFAVREFIIGFGTLYLNTGIGVILENLWGTVRDIFNLTFIFGLVYIGFQIILGVNEAGAKRTIPYLILAALLVNFSLFIVKFIIDFTNYAAAQIYQLFRTAEGNTSGVEISNAFLNAINFSTILGAQGQDAPFMLIIGTLFLFLVLFYVFLSGAILIMIRFIALCFYMIFSPIMFLGWVFPGMGSYTKDFWRGLLGQAFFAPALLFLLYLSISVIIQFREGFQLTLTADNVGEGGSVETVTAFLNLVPFFVLSIGFIIASLVVAKKIGFTGGGMAIAMAEKARGKMQGYVGGAAGMAAYPAKAGLRMGLNSVGDRAERRLNNLQARGGALGAVASWNMVDRAVRGGAVTRLQTAELGTGTTNKKEKEYKDKTRARASQTTAENERGERVALAETAFSDTAITADKLNTALEDLAKSVSKMSTDELVSSSMKKNLYKSHYAVSLTDAQITDLEKSGKLSAADIAKIKTARENGYFNTATSGTAFETSSQPAAFKSGNQQFQDTVSSRQRSNLAARSVTEIGKMPAKLFKEPEFVANLTPLMLAERMKNGLNASDARSIRSNIESYVNGSLVVNGTAITPTQKQKEMWKRWTDNTDRGAEFGLNI